MERGFIFSIDEFYHIYNRGTEKRKIFVQKSDYDRFIKLLYLCNGAEPVIMKLVQGLPLDELFSLDTGSKLVDIGAYCLMPNHLHLLLHERIENGISSFVLKVCTAYSMYFNKKYEHSGSLFQGTFKAEHLDTDNYLKYMYAYIHLNPIKLIDKDWREKGIKNLGKAKSFLYNYKYSSYLDYLGKERSESTILSRESFPEYFSGSKEFKDFVQDWLTYQNLEDN